jgi:hypothetical protein
VRAEDKDTQDVPQRARPFLKGDETRVTTAEAGLGPVADTAMLVFTCETGFDGFALVPDRKSKRDRKLALPKLPSDDIHCELEVLLVANLDKDPADEVVAALHVLDTGVKAWRYVVLHWNGKAFVRVPGLEKKLEAKGQKTPQDVLSKDGVRAALGIKQP